MTGRDSIDLFKQLADNIHVPIAVAGGIDADRAGEAVHLGADIVVVVGGLSAQPM